MGTEPESGRDERAVAAPDDADPVAGLLIAGLDRLQGRDLAGAAAAYRKVLSIDADNAVALHLLGVAHYLSGDARAAVELLARAAERNPVNAEVRSNLGAALHAAGNDTAAADAFRAAATLNPGFVDAHANLAGVLVRLGDDEAAIESFRTAHRLSPQTPRFAKRLGDLYFAHGQYAEAAEWYDRSLAAAPDDAGVLSNAGLTSDRLNRPAEAEAFYRRAIAAAPDRPEISCNLADLLRRMGRAEGARRLMESALAVPLVRWESPANLILALIRAGRWDEAVAAYDSVAAARAADVVFHAGCALAFDGAGRAEVAARAYAAALDACPERDDLRMALAHSLLRLRRIDDAVAVLEAVCPSSPEHLRARLDLCMVLAGDGRLAEACAVARAIPGLTGYRPGQFIRPLAAMREGCDFDGIDRLPAPLNEVADGDLGAVAHNFLDLLPQAESPAQIAGLVSLHRRCGNMLMRQAEKNPLPPSTRGRGAGPLRLGFLSSDLRSHSVARFVLPLLRHYDRTRFEIVFYAPAADAGDAIRQRIRGLVSGFRAVGGLSDRDLAAAIRNDAIDILFELNGFTAQTRLPALAYRPAPVQVCWPGYPFTTGLAAMDYALLDAHVAAREPDWYVEKMLELPGSWLCYDAFEAPPPAGAPPVVGNGHVTFGTLNAPCMFTRRGIGLWARTMNAAPRSRFRFVHPALRNSFVAGNIAAAFAAEGVARERLDFVDDRANDRSRFRCHDDFDITLDTFPLTGGAATCDSLWMGVPVVTRLGPNVHQRLGYGYLRAVGLPDLCAETDAAFVAAAAALAADTDRLRHLRGTLPGMVRDSALGRPEQFAQRFGDLMVTLAHRHGLR